MLPCCCNYIQHQRRRPNSFTMSQSPILLLSLTILSLMITSTSTFMFDSTTTKSTTTVNSNHLRNNFPPTLLPSYMVSKQQAATNNKFSTTTTTSRGSILLYAISSSNDGDDKDGGNDYDDDRKNDASSPLIISLSSSTSTSDNPKNEIITSTISTDAQFGDVVPLKRPSSSASPSSSSSLDASFGDVVPLKRPSSSSSSLDASFGDVVPLKRPNSSQQQQQTATTSSSSSAVGTTTTMVDPNQVKRRNIGVAIVSVMLAIVNYAWQYTHPIEPIQLLYAMEQNSSPVTVIGNTNKPTVVDFWAPWCENCKMLAPTLLQVEEEYKNDVNFVMVNGDAPEAWPLIEAFGVDAIPHLALVEADGTVDTALIGPIPKRWLTSDLDVLIENAKIMNNDNNNNNIERGGGGSSSTTTTTRRQPLPFQMLDVFANRPDQRRIVVSPKASIDS